MVNPKAVLREAKTRFYQSFANHLVPIKLDKAIISITFDDVPRSAFTNAVPILDKYHVKSTFYVSTGLSEQNDKAQENNTDVFLYPDDIVALKQAGHDIACHTYSHYRLDDGNAKDLCLDAKKNTANLVSILGDSPIEHFSYPFGQVNFTEKRLLSQQYKTMRSSRPGLNKGMTDMYLLRATSVYSPAFDKVALTQVIEQAVQCGGWLILYTHGVEANPDAYGCTPEQFEWVVQECNQSDAEILPINAAYQKIINT